MFLMFSDVSDVFSDEKNESGQVKKQKNQGARFKTNHINISLQLREYLIQLNWT